MNEFINKALVKKLGKKKPTAHNVGFYFVPTINAVTRSDDQEAKLKLFQSFVGEEKMEVGLKAGDACHKKQRETVTDVMESLLDTIDESHKCVVVFIDSDKAPYGGLVANMLMSRYNKPALVLREQNSTTWTGSVRSPIPTLDAINAAGLANAQGHGCAHGIVVSKGNLDRLVQWFDAQPLTDTTIYQVTAKLQPKDVTVDLCKQVGEGAMLWGKDVDAPLFYTSFVSMPGERFVYRKSSITVKFVVDGVSFVVFRANEDLAQKAESDEAFAVDALFEPDLNVYEGVEYPQGIISKVETAPYVALQVDWSEIF